MKNLKNKYLLYLIPGILSLISVVFFGTYAIWKVSNPQNSNNIISTIDCVNISITGNNSPLNLNNTYPMTDKEGLKQTPYRFTVKNNCKTNTKYQILLSVENTTTLQNKDYVKIDIDGIKYNKTKLLSSLEENNNSGLTNYLNNYTLITSELSNNESHVYNFRMWLNGDNEHIWNDNTIKDQKFNAKISIVGVVQTEPLDSLKNKIIAQGGGKETIESRGTPDYSQINGTSGIYATEDEYGTSYYYRGLKTELNNNLIWAGFQWKIVRINGDGSIRIVYNGTEAQFNTNGTVNDTGANTQIGTSAWNASSGDAKYLGYMFGGANGVASTSRNGSVASAATYNETNTTMKTTLDNWYKTNIYDKGYNSQVVDNLFCNDRQLQTGPGYGSTLTYYAARHRLSANKSPTLKCGLKNDRFTVNDLTIGNGALTYPVGLLTADEASMAGLLLGSSNSTNYLNTNQHYWLFSPNYQFSASYTNVFVVFSTGTLNSLQC